MSFSYAYGVVIQKNSDGEWVWYLNTYSGSGALGLKGLYFNKAGRIKYLPVVKSCAKDVSIDWEMLDSVIRAESAYNDTALSPKGAFGLTQLMPETAKDLGVDRTVPEANICGGAKYLSLLRKNFGQWDLALAAYNAGGGNVKKYGGIPPFEETQKYVKKVLENYSKLKYK